MLNKVRPISGGYGLIKRAIKKVTNDALYLYQKSILQDPDMTC